MGVGVLLESHGRVHGRVHRAMGAACWDCHPETRGSCIYHLGVCMGMCIERWARPAGTTRGRCIYHCCRRWPLTRCGACNFRRMEPSRPNTSGRRPNTSGRCIYHCCGRCMLTRCGASNCRRLERSVRWSAQTRSRLQRTQTFPYCIEDTASQWTHSSAGAEPGDEAILSRGA